MNGMGAMMGSLTDSMMGYSVLIELLAIVVLALPVVWLFSRCQTASPAAIRRHGAAIFCVQAAQFQGDTLTD